MKALLLIPLVASVASVALAQRPTVTTATYAKAEQRFAKNADAMVLGDRIAPNWIAGSDRFWYRVTTSRGAARRSVSESGYQTGSEKLKSGEW